MLNVQSSGLDTVSRPWPGALEVLNCFSVLDVYVKKKKNLAFLSLFFFLNLLKRHLNDSKTF